MTTFPARESSSWGASGGGRTGSLKVLSTWVPPSCGEHTERCLLDPCRGGLEGRQHGPANKRQVCGVAMPGGAWGREGRRRILCGLHTAVRGGGGPRRGGPRRGQRQACAKPSDTATGRAAAPALWGTGGGCHLESQSLELVAQRRAGLELKKGAKFVYPEGLRKEDPPSSANLRSTKR